VSSEVRFRQVVRTLRTWPFPVRLLRTKMNLDADKGEAPDAGHLEGKTPGILGIPGNEDSEGPSRAWHTHVSHKSVAWQSWADVKAEFGSASLVGNCVVFNIGGNKYRLITRILYPSQKVFILKVMTHAEYDLEKWKVDCGCFEAPPPKPDKKTKTGRKKRGA
jgi:mRNA interferase HigB